MQRGEAFRVYKKTASFLFAACLVVGAALIPQTALAEDLDAQDAAENTCIVNEEAPASVAADEPQEGEAEALAAASLVADDAAISNDAEAVLDDQGSLADDEPSLVSEAPLDETPSSSDEPEATPEVASDTPIAAGSYVISSAVDATKVVDVAAGSTESGANVQLYESNMTDAQCWDIAYDDQGYYTIVNRGSGMALDVSSALAQSGANVQQYALNATPAQKWVIRALGDGYIIESVLAEGLVLDVAGGLSSNGTNIQVYAANGTAAQRFYFFSTDVGEVTAEVVVEDGVYIVVSACDDGVVMEVGGADKGDGALVNVWSDNGTAAQHWKFTAGDDGFYTITNVNSGNVLEVASGSIVPGAKVVQGTPDGSGKQQWALSCIDGLYKLVNKASGLTLDLKGANTANGVAIVGYTNNDTQAQRWTLVSCKTVESGIYVLRSALDENKVLDVAGGGEDAGVNVQIYRENGTDAQRFCVTYDDETGYYTVASVLSEMPLDVSNGSTASGANVQLWTSNGTKAQKWGIRADGEGYVLISALGGNALDVASGSTADSTNVQSYHRNGTAAQRWVFDRQLVISIEGSNGEVVQGVYNNSALSLFLPSYLDVSSVKCFFVGTVGDSILLMATYDGDSTEVFQGASVDLSGYTDGGAAGLHTLYVSSTSSRGTRTQLLRIYKSANVAAVFLVSDDPEHEGRAYIEASSDHSAKTTGSMLMVNADGTIVYDNDLTQIKGRGNSTWRTEKKPYQIKLDKKRDLLSTGDKSNKNKTWVLLANYGDATLLHNSIAYDMGLELGMAGCEGIPVDLYYDGEYRGSYYLCEKIEIKSGRVDIHDLESDIEDANDGVDLDSLPTAQASNGYGYTYQYVRGVNDPDDITGGYLLELDSAYYHSETCWFNTSHGVFVIKSPEVCSQAAVRYISEFVQQALNLADSGVFDVDGALDLDSLAKTYLVSDFFKNIDAFCTSTYFYKDSESSESGDRLMCAPLWDFDTSTGTRTDSKDNSFRSYEGFVEPNATWVYNNASVQERVKELYETTFSALVEDVLLGDESAVGENGFLHSIAYYRSQITWSQYMNEQLFGVTSLGNTFAPFSTWDLNVRYMTSWITYRLAWWDDNYTRLAGANVTNATTVYGGVDYSDVYDYSYYLACNPDVAQAFGGDPQATLWHFVTYGMSEGRRSCRNFDVNAYKARYADLRAAFGNDTAAYYRHYMQYGFYEGRLL